MGCRCIEVAGIGVGASDAFEVTRTVVSRCVGVVVASEWIRATEAAVAHETGFTSTSRGQDRTSGIRNAPRGFANVETIRVVNDFETSIQINAKVIGHRIGINVPNVCGGAIAKGIRETVLLPANGQAVAVPTISVGVKHGQCRTCATENAGAIVKQCLCVVIARLRVGAPRTRGAVASTHTTVVVGQA